MSTDKFDKVPRIVLDKEDRDSFQRTRAAQTTNPTVTATEASAAPVARSGGGLLFLIFFVALGGYGVSYWLYQENQKVVQQLSNAGDRIYELERKLSATGEELDQSAVALRVQVNELKDKTDVLWKEMDKLWASAWRRNQSEIKELNAQLKRTDKSQKDGLSAVQSDISDSNNNLAVIQEQVNQQLKRAEEINNSIDAVVRSRAESQQTVQDMGDQVATVALRIEALIERIDALESLKEQVAALNSRKTARAPAKPRSNTTTAKKAEVKNLPEVAEPITVPAANESTDSGASS